MPDSLIPLADAVPFPIIIVLRDERVAHMNPAAQGLFSPASLGRHYITALRQPSILDAVEASLRDGTRRVTAWLGAEAGRETVWRVTVSPLTLSLGSGVVLSFEDVTALEGAEQMRRDFVANVSHELRTPLTALLGFIETLKGAARDDPAARSRFLTIMEREAGRMVRLVEDLLSLARVEADERLRPVGPVDLAALAASVALSFGPQTAALGITIELRLPEAPVIVPGDEGQLRQVLTNLTENALKYGGQSSPVVIALTQAAPEPALRGDGVRLSVIDRGEGIAAHHIPRLTERFYRIDAHRSREVGGTGLGLAIVKHIVNRHRGRLRIDSTPGEGSTFTVILPIQ